MKLTAAGTPEPEEELEQEPISERLSPVEMPPPPADGGDLHHRLGYLEATLRQTEELRQQERAILEQQASALQAMQQQAQIREQELTKVKTEVEVEEKRPSLLDRILGGSRNR
jgi:hypothetical protein